MVYTSGKITLFLRLHFRLTTVSCDLKSRLFLHIQERLYSVEIQKQCLFLIGADNLKLIVMVHHWTMFIGPAWCLQLRLIASPLGRFLRKWIQLTGCQLFCASRCLRLVRNKAVTGILLLSLANNTIDSSTLLSSFSCRLKARSL